MNPTQTQPSSPQGNPNQAAASLAFATQLQEQMMPKVEQPQAPTESQQPQGGEQNPDTTKPAPPKDDGRIAELELSISKQLDEMRKELKGDAKAQIDNLKKDIELALQDEQA